MRPLRAQLIALVAALGVLLSSGGLARTQFFCHMMNRVVATCCCEVDAKDHDPDCGARIRATDCCERVSAVSRAPTLKPVLPDFSVPPAAIVAVLAEPVYAAPGAAQVTVLPRQARAPPIVGPPLFIVHCSLLT